MSDESAPEPVQASLLGAVVGGSALLVVALPLFLMAAGFFALWSRLAAPLSG